MLRKSISFMVAGLLTTAPLWVVAYAIIYDWRPQKPVLILIALVFCCTLGAFWLYEGVRDLLKPDARG